MDDVALDLKPPETWDEALCLLCLLSSLGSLCRREMRLSNQCGSVGSAAALKQLLVVSPWNSKCNQGRNAGTRLG